MLIYIDRVIGIGFESLQSRCTHALYWYTYCTRNINRCVLVLEVAHRRTIVISQQCKFVLIKFMYFRILIF